MATTRERREARAARLREWAGKREASGNAALEQSRQMMDAIPFGQPILVGHHSERADRNYRDRAWNTMGRGVEDTRKAASMTARADNIEAQADRAIYDDDPDVADRLNERIAELEAQRDEFKRHNREARKAGGETLPAYVLSNLGANIRRYKQRLQAVERGAHKRTREVVNRYAGTCAAWLAEPEGSGRCGVAVAAGEGVARKEHGGDWEVFCDGHR